MKNHHILMIPSKLGPKCLSESLKRIFSFQRPRLRKVSY